MGIFYQFREQNTLASKETTWELKFRTWIIELDNKPRSLLPKQTTGEWYPSSVWKPSMMFRIWKAIKQQEEE